jgi:hypothetical protein
MFLPCFIRVATTWTFNWLSAMMDSMDSADRDAHHLERRAGQQRWRLHLCWAGIA